MNYRHAFHAGNFADVLKHVVLVRIVAHLCAKPAAFRVIDTHAGAGLYDLQSPEAVRSPEWQGGIARLRAAPLSEPARALVASYLAAVAAFDRDGRLAGYPGSPVLARAMLRPQDRLLACEREPAAAAALARGLAGDPRVKALAMDGWTALRAYVPPKERRGLVLIDPPFEQEGEMSRLVAALETAHRKWATGIYLAWYPIKNRREVETPMRRLARAPVGKLLRAELSVGASGERLAACGLLVVNPPWMLADDLGVLLPELAAVLADGNGGGHRLEWLGGGA